MLKSIDHLLQNLKFRQKGILLVAIPLVFEILFVSVLSINYGIAQQETKAADHSRRVLTITDAITTSLFALGASFFIAPTGDRKTIQMRAVSLQESLTNLVESLVVETSSYPDEKRFVDDIVSATAELRDKAQRMQELAANPLQMISQNEFRKIRRETKSSLHKMVGALDKLIAYEQSMSGPRLAIAHASRNRMHMLLYGGVALNVLVSIYLVVVFGKQITNRLSTVSRNAVSMSQKRQPQEVVSGSDELADLDKLIHRLSAVLIETSQRERAMIDHTIDVICALSPEHKILNINKAVVHQWGFAPESLTDCSVIDLVLADNQASFRNELETARGRSGGKQFQCRLVKRDGNVIDSAWSVLWSDTDESYFCIVRDVSAEKETDRLRQKFLSMITHDLRGPLANFKSFVEMLDNGIYGKLTESGARASSKLSSSVDYLISLTNDLLDIGKIQSGHVALLLSKFRVEELLDESASVLESLLKAKAISVKFQCAPDLVMNADYLRLKQTLSNLLANALKFSPPGSTICLRAETGKAPGSVRVAVLDKGPGLSESDLQRVFDLYAQADNQSASNMKGFGLGLSIARAVVEAHGGTIGVVNREEGGAEFWFELPNYSSVELVNHETPG